MRPEDRLRAHCRMYLDKALPSPAFWSAIEHGRKHAGTDQQRMREWQHMKAQGVKTGLSDVMIWYLGKFLAPECKAGKNGTQPAQDVFRDAMLANRFSYRVIRSVAELDRYLRDEGIPIPRSLEILAMSYDAALAIPEATKPKAKRASSRQVVKTSERAGIEAIHRAMAKKVFAA